MQFKEAFPELSPQPPQMAGAPNRPATALNRLRRQALVDLAKAYDLPIDPDAPKSDLLPALIDAEKRGVFNDPPEHPYYLRKAAYNPDLPHENNDWGNPPPGGPQRGRPQSDFRRLQKLGARLGVARVGMTKAELEAAIKSAMEEEHAQRQGETYSEPPGPGLSGEGEKLDRLRPLRSEPEAKPDEASFNDPEAEHMT